MSGPAANPLRRPWDLEAEAVASALGVDPEHGLDADDTLARLERFGANALEQHAGPSVWQLALRQFANTMTTVLLVAAIVTLLIHEYVDAVAIFVILLLNAIIGFAQERRAERAMAALQELTTTDSRVLRDGQVRDVPSPDIVPGDIVELAGGDVVPADLRLYEVRGLRVNEAALTGESEPAAKTADRLTNVAPALIADQENMAFKGTAVTYGRARGIVVATGMATEVGQIARLLQKGGDTGTPLQRRLSALGRRMAAIALVIVAAVFVAGIVRGEPADDMFLTAVSLAVAAIPEGLPAVVTVSLALGARRMADRHALVRKLLAVETLGSVTVICSDKTGTLTQNRMTVERVWAPSGFYDVEGAGYEPRGTVRPRAGTDDRTGVDRAGVERIAMIAAACNDAVLHAPTSGTGEWAITGDPTEGALLAFAGKLGVERPAQEARLPRRAEVAFDSARKRMTTVHAEGSGSWIATKGALPALIPLLDEEERDRVAGAEAASDAMARDGYRVLALAERHTSVAPDDLDRPEYALHLAGLVGIADPPRAEARDAIALCTRAGIATVMITGDDPRTATAVAKRLDLAEHLAPVTGSQLGEMSDEELAARVGDIRVYARANPEHKLRIVEAWKARGAIVAMTGDGVNDAPALQRADIGVAMGITGTDVSKEAADMVLADDNFATIVGAVEEGRRIYDNIRRFVRYLLTTNSGELLVMFIAPLLGLPIPLLPLQILWVNLVTDGLPAVALGLEPPEANTMDRPPRLPGESILGRGLWQHALWVGALMAAIVIPMQALARAAGWPWQTMVVTTLAFLQLGHAMAVRSEDESTFRLGLRTNRWLAGAVVVTAFAQLAVVYVPGLQDVFQTEALGALQLAIVAVCSSAVFVAVELEKLLRRRAHA